MDAHPYQIQPLLADHEPFLWEMLYQAIHIPAGYELPPRTLLYLPDLACYVQDWGQSSDYGLLARDLTTGTSLGAVWIRLLTGENKGYGYVDDQTPELSIAVLPQYRGQGLGTALLSDLISTVSGYTAISLSVSASNPALRLYKRFEFKVVSQKAGSLTMVRKITRE